MSNNIIKVDNLSKVYRIGLKEQKIDTLGGAIAKCVSVVTTTQKNVSVSITKTVISGTVVTYSATPSYNFTLPFRGVTDFAVGNLDGKNLYDFVFVGTEGIKVVRDSATTGVYNFISKLNVIGSFNTVKITDVNGDTKNDLILTTASGDAFYVMLGDGHGAFGKLLEFKSKIITGNVTDVKFFAVNTTTVTSSSYALSASSGYYGITTFSVAPTSSVVPTSTVITVDSTYGAAKNSFKLAIGDMNGDGINDIVTVDNDNFIRILNGRYTTKAKFAVLTSLPINEPVDYIETGDFNGDGKTDIIYLGSVSRKVSVLIHQ